MPCSPPIAFCSTVGQAIFQTARAIGPSTIDRSNVADRARRAARRPPALRMFRSTRSQLPRCGDGAAGLGIIQGRPHSVLFRLVLRIAGRRACASDDGRLTLQRFVVPRRTARRRAGDSSRSTCSRAVPSASVAARRAASASSMRTTSSESGCSQANHGSLITSCSSVGIRRRSPAIQLVRGLRVVEQHLVQVQQTRADLAQARPRRSDERRAERGQPGLRSSARLRATLEVERRAISGLGRHAATGRAVVIELERVAVGIAQIECLDDTVIERAVERSAGGRQAASEHRQRRADPGNECEIPARPGPRHPADASVFRPIWSW